MDDGSSIFMITALIVLIMLSAFFSASETAYSSLNMIRLKSRAEDGDKQAAKVLALAERYDSLLSTILIGNNIVNIGASSLATVLFSRLLGNAYGPTASTIVMTLLVLTFGEITPKMIAKENSERICMAFGYPIRAIQIILYPITIIFTGLKFVLNKIFKSRDDDKITEEELLSMVEEAQEDGSLDSQERELISSAIEFDDCEVQDILVPRVNVIAVPTNMAMDKIKAIFLEYNYSRLPVYKDSIDQIVGMIHNIDFFTALEKGEKNIKNYITPVAVATEHMKISALLKSMQRQKVHMAVVVDEYGGTLGIVTLEDILEELVGEIWDEHDEVVNYFTKIDDENYLVDGRAELDDFFKEFNIDENETENFDSQTVSGWVIEQFGEIPKKSQSFDFKNLTIVVNKLTARKIIEIKVRINPQKEEEDEQEQKFKLFDKHEKEEQKD